MDEKQIEITAAEAKQLREDCERYIKNEERLNRLKNNQDFKELFLEEYCKNECERLVHLLSEPNLMMSEKASYFKEDIHDQMIAVAKFSHWLRNVHLLAEQARNSLDSLNQATIQ